MQLNVPKDVAVAIDEDFLWATGGGGGGNGRGGGGGGGGDQVSLMPAVFASC